MAQRSALLTVLVLCVALAGVVPAQGAGTRRLLIACGHPGDEDYRARFVESIDTLVGALESRGEFAASHRHVLFGTAQMQTDGLPLPAAVSGPCTAETLRDAVETIRAELQEDDVLWVVLCGHSHYDGRQAWFNVAGPDPSQADLGELFAGITCRECLVWMTTSVSGFFIRPLSAEGRIVISATEADREVNATLFPHVLAETLASPPPREELDADRDGRITAFDLYLTVCRGVAARYVADDLIATEHAHLDDNGDGRGTEVQRRYLSEELGGSRQAGAALPKLLPNQDGVRSAQVELPWLAVAEQPAAP